MENVWYNEYRPKKFEDVLGQDLAVTVLSNAIITKRVKNGYLLSGSRGVGKTTLARIFANNLNSIDKNPQANIDIYEMDAASNTSVDDVRLLIENASTPPLVGDYKVFIIDEVHMLSKSAMNALLKILEEPPVYLVFVFATTNPEKILPTILSRLIKLDLNNHTIEDLEKNLKRIANDKSMNIDDKSINLIAKKANGGQRDAINYLQTLNEYNLEEYNISNVSSILGVLPDELVKSIIYTVKSSNVTLEYKKNLISVIQKLQISPIAMINQILEDLLDKHFNSNTENSDLIAILADYVTLNLPVTN
jgi:DNA polymerase III subunit gamma/tau